MYRPQLDSYDFDDVDISEFNDIAFMLMERSINYGHSGHFSPDPYYIFEMEPYYIGGEATVMTTDGYMRDFPIARFVGMTYTESSFLGFSTFRVYITDDPQTFQDFIDRYL